MSVTEGPALADTLRLSLLLLVTRYSHPWKRSWLEARVTLGAVWDCWGGAVSPAPCALTC